MSRSCIFIPTSAHDCHSNDSHQCEPQLHHENQIPGSQQERRVDVRDPVGRLRFNDSRNSFLEVCRSIIGCCHSEQQLRDQQRIESQVRNGNVVWPCMACRGSEAARGSDQGSQQPRDNKHKLLEVQGGEGREPRLDRKVARRQSGQRAQTSSG